MTPQEDTEYIDPDIRLRNPCPLMMGGEEVKGCGRAAGGYLAYIGSSSLTDVSCARPEDYERLPCYRPMLSPMISRLGHVMYALSERDTTGGDCACILDIIGACLHANGQAIDLFDNNNLIFDEQGGF